MSARLFPPQATPPAQPVQPHRRTLLAGLGSLAASASWLAPSAAQAADAALATGQPAPDFTLPSLAGPNLRLAEQRGQVVLINFWATWCGPCREEMPLLDALYKRYKPLGFTLLGVNVDDDPAKARTAAAQLGVSFPVLLDTSKQVSRQYALSTMPSSVVLGRDGRVQLLHRGYRSGDLAIYEQQLRTLLKD